MIIGSSAQIEGYRDNVAYLLDTGNPYKHHILDAHGSIVKSKDRFPLNVGALGFDCDDAISALQAADVVSWSVRRNLASELKSGFEPLAELFDSKHREIPYAPEWMMSVAEAMRANMKP